MGENVAKARRGKEIEGGREGAGMYVECTETETHTHTVLVFFCSQ